MDVDVEILVQFDDALVGAGLFFDGALADVVAVGQRYLVFFLVLLAVLAETVYHFRLGNHLLGEGLQVEIVVLLEVVAAAVEHVGLVGLADTLELLGQLVGDKLFVCLHLGVGVVVLILALAYVQEVVFPIEGIGAAVGGIDHAHDIAFVVLAVENQCAFVQLVGVDAVLHLQAVLRLRAGVVSLRAPPFFVVQNLEERLFVFGLEKSDGIHLFTIEHALGEIDHKEFATLDIGVGGGVVEVARQPARLFHQAIGLCKNLLATAIDLVEVQIVVVVEVVVFFYFERGEEIADEDVLQLLGEF